MNTFGDSTKKFQLCSASNVREQYLRPDVPALRCANSFVCPSGREAGRGYVLLPRYELDQLNRYATNLQLQIGALEPFINLSIVKAQCVTRGLEADPNALYLIEVTDSRGLIKTFPLNAQYNVRAPAYPGQQYSLSAGWTWTTMIEDLWTRMSSFLGTFPGLPYTPTGTPDDWIFEGVSCWDALCDVLEHLNMRIVNIPWTGYSIAARGATDESLTALQTKYETHLIDDYEWATPPLPASVTVYFRIQAEVYGAEETVRRDSSQWTSAPLHSVTVAGSTGVGQHFLHDDFPVRRDMDGNILAADVTMAATIAAERVAKFYAARSAFMTQVYADALPFTPGSLVDCVEWSLNGWRTTIRRGDGIP